MKKPILLFTAAAFSLMVSCSDDDSASGVQLQNHDDNEMMMVMHSMMDEMSSMEMTHDPDVDFAAMMIMHHQGAIAMANLEIEKGKNAEMKAMAQAIITAQQQEIQGMDKMDAMADQQMITGDIDNDFASLMIIHHQAAIDSASSYLHHGSNGELSAMANAIIEMQSEEIITFSNWLAENKR